MLLICQFFYFWSIGVYNIFCETRVNKRTRWKNGGMCRYSKNSVKIGRALVSLTLWFYIRYRHCPTTVVIFALCWCTRAITDLGLWFYHMHLKYVATLLFVTALQLHSSAATSHFVQILWRIGVVTFIAYFLQEVSIEWSTIEISHKRTLLQFHPYNARIVALAR